MKGTGPALRSSVAAVLWLFLSMQMGTLSTQTLPTGGGSPIFFESKQFQRWNWLFQRRASRKEGILPSFLSRAARQLGRIRELDRRQIAAQSSQTGEIGDPDRWISIGPTPIRVADLTYFAGRTATVAVDPQNFKHWLIGAAQGGIWETMDAGKSWESRTDHLESLASGALAFAPGNHKVVYAGTGESTFSGDSYGGLGLLKSLDGGSTWRFVNQGHFAGRGISEIRVHPDDSDILLVTSVSAVSPVPDRAATGIHKSTDGGETFKQRIAGQANDLEVHPDNFDAQYASLAGIFGSEEDEGLYRSLDEGDNWTMVAGPWSDLEGGVGRMEMSVSPTRPDHLVVSVQDAFTDSDRDGRLLGIWLTRNAWASTPDWVQLPSPPTGSTVWYNQQIAFHPANHHFILFGEIALWIFDGSSWSRISPPHVDQHAFAWAGGQLIVGNDGGVYSSLDLGGSWFVHNLGLTITQFYLGSLHPSDPEFAIGGSQDNGTEMWDGSNQWRLLVGGDGAANVISQQEPDQHWAVSFQNLNIFRTTDGGRSYSRASERIDRSDPPFIAMIEGCAFDEDVLVAGTVQVWKTIEFFSAESPIWEAASPDLGSAVSALAFSPADSSCRSYAAGTLAGSVHLTTDGGLTWTDLDPLESVPAGPVTDLEFDPDDSDVLYLSLGGFDGSVKGPFNHVFVTDQALQPEPAWQNISPPIDVPVQTVALSPQDSNTLYAGTDLGLWKSPDGGQDWHSVTLDQGFPTVAVLDLEAGSNGQLVAFTHGRGAFLRTEALNTDLSVQLEDMPRSGFTGEILNWDLRATNNGPADGRQIEVTLSFDAEVELQQVPGECVAGSEVITCRLEALGKGQSAGLRMAFLPAGAGTVTAFASISGPALDPIAANNEATAEVLVVSPSAEWFIPFFGRTPTLESGIAVSNISSFTSNLLFRAFPGEGHESLPFNPRSYLLERRRQRTLLPEEIFGDWPAAPGWMWIRADQPEIVALFQLFGPGSLDGGAAFARQFQRFIFTRVLQGQQSFRNLPSSTHFSFANPNQESVRVRLQLGAEERILTIQPHGFLYTGLSDLFGVEEATRGVVLGEVLEGPGLIGFQIIEVDGGKTIIGLNPAHDFAATRFYSAQVASAENLFTNLKLHNSALETRRLLLEVRRDSGELAAGPIQVILGPGEEIQEDIPVLFGSSGGPAGKGPADLLAGSLDILADGPGIVGDIVFGESSAVFAAALPLQAELFSRAAFSQAASGLGFFTGIALYNPGPLPTEARLTVFSPSGSGRGSILVSLGAGQRLARTLAELIPTVAGHVDGYIILESGQPVVAQQFFADQQLTFLSAVPGTPLD